MISENKNINKIKNELNERKGQQWWKHEEVRFICLQCGACCGGEPGAIWVTAGEISAIADFLGAAEAELRGKYLTRSMGRSSIKELKNYDCVFLKRNQMRCKIYNVRPLQCRLFPFWPSILREKKNWNYYATRCPGMNQGLLYTVKMIEDLQINKIWNNL